MNEVVFACPGSDPGAECLWKERDLSSTAEVPERTMFWPGPDSDPELVWESAPGFRPCAVFQNKGKQHGLPDFAGTGLFLFPQTIDEQAHPVWWGFGTGYWGKNPENTEPLFIVGTFSVKWLVFRELPQSS